MLNKILQLAVAVICVRANLQDIYRNQMRREEYDYIVVGGGTAGSIVASRLTEDESASVLVIEAGGLPNGMTEIPMLGIHLLGTDLDWSYYSEPQQQACLGLKDKQAYIPVGKVLGGSSTINSLLYVRGDKSDYDEWARGGAAGWSWDEVGHYFRKLEDIKDPVYARDASHGTGGPQTVTISDYISELGDSILQAGQNMGYDIVDLNGESPHGFSRVQGSVRDGRRCSTEKGYLRPAAARENLDILYNAHVTKVLFSEDKNAEAVRFEQNNVSRVIKANKEIILSAGAFGTPKILMLSGVGPKEHLQELEIPVVVDLPVGENFQDHVMVASQVYAVNDSIGLLHSRMVNAQTVAQFVEGKGPLTVPLGVEVIAAVNSKYQDENEHWPDLRLYFLSVLLQPPIADEGEGKVQFQSTSEGVSVNPSVCRPKSRGFVKLRNTDPYEHVVVDPRYLTHEQDVKVLIEGMKKIEDVMKQPSMSRHGPVRVPEVVPGCERMDTESDDYLICVARSLTITGYHPCCTAKMGRTEDPSTVVDPNLRVKGVTGLRVADASVMPTITSGNTMAPSLMIGEKAADLIKGRHWDPAQNKIVTTA